MNRRGYFLLRSADVDDCLDLDAAYVEVGPYTIQGGKLYGTMLKKAWVPDLVPLLSKVPGVLVDVLSTGVRIGYGYGHDRLLLRNIDGSLIYEAVQPDWDDGSGTCIAYGPCYKYGWYNVNAVPNTVFLSNREAWILLKEALWTCRTTGERTLRKDTDCYKLTVVTSFEGVEIYEVWWADSSFEYYMLTWGHQPPADADCVLLRWSGSPSYSVRVPKLEPGPIDWSLWTVVHRFSGLDLADRNGYDWSSMEREVTEFLVRLGKERRESNGVSLRFHG